MYDLEDKIMLVLHWSKCYELELERFVFACQMMILVKRCCTSLWSSNFTSLAAKQNLMTTSSLSTYSHLALPQWGPLAAGNACTVISLEGHRLQELLKVKMLKTLLMWCSTLPVSCTPWSKLMVRTT